MLGNQNAGRCTHRRHWEVADQGHRLPGPQGLPKLGPPAAPDWRLLAHTYTDLIGRIPPTRKLISHWKRLVVMKELVESKLFSRELRMRIIATTARQFGKCSPKGPVSHNPCLSCTSQPWAAAVLTFSRSLHTSALRGQLTESGRWSLSLSKSQAARATPFARRGCISKTF